MRYRGRIDEIISEEESYKAQKISMDKQIDFTEIHIYINCLVNKEKTPFLQRAKESLSEIGRNAEDAILSGLNWFVLSAIWLVFISTILTILIIVVRFASRLGKVGRLRILDKLKKVDSRENNIETK